FDDGSRVGRPLPGTEYPPALKRVMAYRRYRVFERALRQRGWRAEAVSYLKAGRSEAAQDFSDNISGWPVPGLVAIVAREVRHAEFESAATIVRRALRSARPSRKGVAP